MKLFRDDMNVDIASPLSAAECMLRLRERTDPLWKFWGQPVVGNFSGNAVVSLQKRKFYANPLQTVLRIKMVQKDGGTLLRCRPGIGVAIKILMGIWLSIFLISGGMFFAMSLYDMIASDTPQYPRDTVGVMGFPGLFIFAIALYTFGRWWGRRDREYLVNFVKNTVSGHCIAGFHP